MKTKNKIDQAITEWMSGIVSAAEVSIPKSTVTYYAHPISSDYLKLLELKYRLIDQQYTSTKQKSGAKYPDTNKRRGE